MTFNHNIIQLPKLNRVDSESGPRLYKNPDGNSYPSVTSVIGHQSDTSGLDAWRKRVGEKEADRVTNRSARRGTAVHSLCEKLILNQTIDYRKEMPINSFMFQQIKKHLVKRVDNILGCESMLYSDKLMTAGTADLIAEWDKKKAIIDFKTSAKSKKLEWIDNYFIQTAFYGYMFWERTGIICPKLVVIIALEEESEAQVYEDNINNWIDKAFDVSRKFHANY